MSTRITILFAVLFMAMLLVMGTLVVVDAQSPTPTPQPGVIYPSNPVIPYHPPDQLNNQPERIPETHPFAKAVVVQMDDSESSSSLLERVPMAKPGVIRLSSIPNPKSSGKNLAENLAVNISDEARPIKKVDTSYAQANYMWEYIAGSFGVEVTVWYTVTDSGNSVKESGSGTTEPDDWWETYCGCDMVPGDQVEVVSGDGFSTTMTLIPIDGEIDPDTDVVSGHMELGSFPASGTYNAWSQGRRDGFDGDFSIDENGDYSFDTSADFDLQTGDWVTIWYLDPNGNYIGTELYTLYIQVLPNYDIVGGLTVPDSSVVVTVEEKSGASGSSDSYGWFDTDTWDNWDSGIPDIQPGDIVKGKQGEFTKEVDPVGTIEGVVNEFKNVFTGTLDVDGFTDPL